MGSSASSRIKSSDTPTANHPRPKNLVRSQYKDVMVKVDGDIYHLNRLQLALKSNYFKKLFIEDSADKNCDLVEIPAINSDIFSAVVDIIYGESLDSVMTTNNCVSLFMAMAHLQMELDSKTFDSFNLGMNYIFPPKPSQDPNIFKLYRCVVENAKYRYLLPVFNHYLSRDLAKLQNLDEFLSLPFDDFIQIIMEDCEFNDTEYRKCTKICVKWICYDLENRLPHIIDLVNAAKVRFDLPNEIHPEDITVRLPAINDQLNQDTLAEYFYKLLVYAGEINSDIGISKIQIRDPDDEDEDKDEERSDRRYYCYSYDTSERDDNVELLKPNPNLEKFLRNGHLYDITVKADEKTYKLHRFVLESASGYFKDIFSAEAILQCEGMPALPSKDKEYSLEEIDQATFDFIVEYMYLGKTDFPSDIVVRLLKSAHILRIDGLLEQCKRWLKKEDNSKKVSAADVFEILNFTHENNHHEDLNEINLCKYIDDCWPEIGNVPQLADFFKAIVLPEETPGLCDENKVAYLLDKVDRETFRVMIDTVYFEWSSELNENNIVNVLKAGEMFKMEKLVHRCVQWLIPWPKNITHEDAIEVLHFSLRNIEYEDLRKMYFSKHLKEWPQIDNSLFCSISYEFLEDILTSPLFFFDDPRTMLDICSKWIFHDVQSRYRLIPRIAFAMSRNRMVDCADYAITCPPDLNQCSQDLIKDKLWQILSSTSVLPSALLSKNEKNKAEAEQPVFITCMKDGSLCISNANLDIIKSLYFLQSTFFKNDRSPIKATMINDNVFILTTHILYASLHVYNCSLKKSFFLTRDRQIPVLMKKKEATLLNCCDEIYCCLGDGAVLKYSFEFNRWKIFLEPEPDKDQIWFASDGSKLHRMYKIPETANPEANYLNQSFSSYVIENYNFEQNEWVSLPNVPLLKGYSPSSGYSSSYYTVSINICFINDHELAVLCGKELFLIDLHSNSPTWQVVDSLPHDSNVRNERSFITQDPTDGILYILNNKLHHLSLPNQRWKLRKEYSWESIVGAIHRPVYTW